jgi:hypothetical protein
MRRSTFSKRNESRGANCRVPRDNERPFVDALEKRSLHHLLRRTGSDDATVIEKNHR